MSQLIEKQIAEREAKLLLLFREVHGTAIFDRVQLWIARMCSGKLLADYLHDPTVPAKDRVMVATHLVEILLAKQYDRLPELPPMENRNAPAAPAPTVPPSALEPLANALKPEDAPPAPDELRALIRREARLQLAEVLETVARVLRETT